MTSHPASQAHRPHAGEDGFTLVELLVVLGIIALLAAVVAPQVLRYLSSAKSDTAAAQLKNIESALELYYLDNGQYPKQEDGLMALVIAPAGADLWRGPYLKKATGLTDPWGRPFGYKSPGEHGAFDLFSLGRDGAPGGDGDDKDILNW